MSIYSPGGIGSRYMGQSYLGRKTASTDNTKTFSESLIAEEQLKRGVYRGVFDVLNLADVVGKVGNYVRSFVDSVAVSEIYERVVVRAVEFFDSIKIQGLDWVLADECDGTFINSSIGIGFGGGFVVGQSIEAKSEKIVRIDVRCKPNLSEGISGGATMNLFAHSGTFGSTSVGSGNPFATSIPLDVSTLDYSLGYPWYSFFFDEENQPSLVVGEKYVIGLMYDLGDGDPIHTISLNRVDNASHEGNACAFDGFSWYVYDADVDSRVFSSMEGVQRKISLSRVLTHTLSVDEVFQRLVQSYRTFTDGISLSDNLSKSMVYVLSLLDSFSVTGFIKRTVDLFRRDDISAGEDFDRGLSYTRDFNDNVTVVDDFDKNVVLYNEFSDGIGVNDSLSRDVEIALNDELSGDDLLEKNVQSGRLFNDTLSLSSVVSSLRRRVKILEDAVSISSSIVKQAVVGFVDSVNVVEIIVKYINGIRITWEKAKRIVAGWTGSSRSESGVNKLVRKVTDWTKSNRSSSGWDKSERSSDSWDKKEKIN